MQCNEIQRNPEQCRPMLHKVAQCCTVLCTIALQNELLWSAFVNQLAATDLFSSSSSLIVSKGLAGNEILLIIGLIYHISFVIQLRTMWVDDEDNSDNVFFSSNFKSIF